MAQSDGLTLCPKGLVFDGQITTGGSINVFVCKGLAGFGDSFFSNHWYVFILRKPDGTTTPPFGEYQLCTFYQSADGGGLFGGEFITNPFTVPLPDGCEIYLIHESLAALLPLLNNVNLNVLALLAFIGHPFVEQQQVSFSKLTGIAEQDIFNFPLVISPFGGNIHYKVHNMRLYVNGAPGPSTITITVYEFENLIFVPKTYLIDTNNFGFKRTLMDILGAPEISGDAIQMTVKDNAGLFTEVRGSYEWAKTT